MHDRSAQQVHSRYHSGASSKHESHHIALPHPLIGSSLRNWGQILRRHWRDIEFGSLPTAALISAAGALSIPIRAFEQLRYGAAIDRHELGQPPIFIVGHWRSGTTNLHNLMLQDSALASVTLMQCVLPHGFMTLGKPVSRILSKRLPATRPIDSVPLGFSEPMSEDFGLVGLTHLTHYLSYFFPQRAEQLFRESVLFDGLSEAEVADWQHQFQYLLKKVSFASGGRRLLLKNPANTGRIAELLKMYPNAGFIHLIRNPYRVHSSSVQLMQRFVRQFGLQSMDSAHLESFVSERYQLMMNRWLETRHLIPQENLIELRHEELVRDPLGSLETIYDRWQMSGFPEIKSTLEQKLSAQNAYKNNVYDYSEDYLQRIQPYVGEFAERWGYSMPPVSRPACDGQLSEVS